MARPAITITAAEAAELIGVHPETFRKNFVRTGTISPVSEAFPARYRRSEVQALARLRNKTRRTNGYHTTASL